MPVAEVAVDTDLVARLVGSQFPALLDHRDLRPHAFGWDNVVYRLGDDLAVRLPRRAAGAALVEREQRWLPELAPTLPLPIPAPLRAGRPGEGYPWRWSICPWLPGDIAARTPPAEPVVAAETLGRVVAARHQPAPADAPANPVRGVPLVARDEATRRWLDQLGAEVPAAAVLVRWEQAVAVAPWHGRPRWLHGDLHPANLLVDGGSLAAVIDFGDLTAGDPATDLAVAWMLFDAGPARAAFRHHAGYAGDEPTWRRAHGWALGLALAYLANSADHEVIAALGRRTLEAVLDDPLAG